MAPGLAVPILRLADIQRLLGNLPDATRNYKLAADFIQIGFGDQSLSETDLSFNELPKFYVRAMIGQALVALRQNMVDQAKILFRRGLRVAKNRPHALDKMIGREKVVYGASIPDALAAGMTTVQSTLPSIQTDLVFNGLYCESHDDRCRKGLPWYDVRIREAINRAINREEMLNVLFPSGGYSLHARYTMVRGNEGYDPTLEQRFEAEYGYDPEKAKQLMQEAGYPDAFEDPTIPIILTPMAGMPEVPLQQEMVYLYLAKVGFKAEIVELDYARVRAMGRERELYMINPGRNAPPRPTEVAFRAFYTNPGGGLQGWEDDWTASHIETLITTIDPAQRDELARELQNYLFEQYVDIPLFDGFTQLAINPKYVAGWQFPGVTSAGYGHWQLIKAAR